MQVSDNTFDVLKNFSTINSGLLFTKGNVQRTVSPGKVVLAEAVIDDSVPDDFCIFDLNQLLSILSLHKTAPELEVNGNNIVVQGYDGRSKITYRCCDASMIKTPPKNNIVLPSEDATFTLSEDDYAWIMRAAAVLNSPNISITSRDGKLFVAACDVSDDSSHHDALEVGVHTGPAIDYTFKTENWKMLPGSYTVTLSPVAAHFHHQTRKIQYWVAIESKGN